MATRTAYAPVSGEVLTASNLAKLAGGWIGYNEVTANQSSITTETDLTGLSVSVTVGASRRIRVTANCGVSGNTASNIADLHIKEGSTYLQTITFTNSPSGGATGFATGSVVLTPSSGAHTYKLALALNSGGSSVNLIAASARPAFILVEDIGTAT